MICKLIQKKLPKNNYFEEHDYEEDYFQLRVLKLNKLLFRLEKLNNKLLKIISILRWMCSLYINFRKKIISQ